MTDEPLPLLLRVMLALDEAGHSRLLTWSEIYRIQLLVEHFWFDDRLLAYLVGDAA